MNSTQQTSPRMDSTQQPTTKLPLRPSITTSSSPQMDRVEAWTATQAADVVTATSISSPTPLRTPRRGASVKLDIPLDEPPQDPAPRPQQSHTVHKRREPIRRDSLKRREALLKGKEGSRARNRWERSQLLDNPYAQPPLPSDWAVQPTHSVQSVPYFLAPLWDAEYARLHEGRRMQVQAAKKPRDEGKAKVVQELRARMKRARGARGLLRDLEEEVREFIWKWEGREREEVDSEDEEIVFVGRDGGMSDEAKKREDEELEKDLLVFESLAGDHGAAFGRYLSHAIGQYYGLDTWSVTRGNPARREAYVGLKTDPKTRRPSLMRSEMPQPLYAVV